MKEELINMLEELKEELKNDSMDKIRHKSAENMVVVSEIIKDMKKV